eukprot:TRINITY_DN7487_c0_g1_i1.p1 TRINITY_DN7487_c0_g1~~TRINITY_DN7487_c0_g1_i1.p1  ORF type:complete len:947 (-),score=198.23 TRINITY_DN7487_c0_g1_i1:92-2932(-)
MDPASVGHAAAAAAAADGNAEIVVQQQNGGSTTQRKILFQHTLSSFLHDPSAKRAPWNPPVVPPSPAVAQVSPHVFASYLEKIREPYRMLTAIRAELQVKRPDESGEILDDAATLKEIPAMYFKESFNLSDPQMFKSALTLEDSFDISGEKLSHYLDVVEMEITKKISIRSAEFFNALRGLQTLHQEVLDACHEIDVLRDGMKTIDDRIVKESLTVVQRRARKERLGKVLEKVATMKALLTSEEAIKMLMNSEDYFGALDIVRSTQQTLEEELPNIHSLRNLAAFLHDTTEEIEQRMSAQFVEFARGEQDLKEDDRDQMIPLARQLISIGRFQKTLQLWRDDQQDHLKLMVAQTIQPGLASLDKFDENLATQLEIKEFVAKLKSAFRRSMLIISRIKSTNLMIVDVANRLNEADAPLLKQVEADLAEIGLSLENAEPKKQKKSSSSMPPSVPSSSAMSTLVVPQQASSILGSDVFASDDPAEDALSNSHLTEEDLLSALDPKAAEAAAEEAASPAPVQQAEVETDEEKQARLYKEKLISQGRELLDAQRKRRLIIAECAEILFSVAELAHVRTARLLKVRSNLHRRLPLEHFHLLHEEVNNFIRDSELLIGRQCYGLRPSLLAQSRAFLENFHTNRVNNLRLTLENDSWDKMEVPREFIFIFRCLVDPSEDLHVENRSAEVDKSVPDNTRELDVLGEKYPGVNSLLMFGKILHDYLICVDTLPVLNQDMITRLTEILQLFNRRTAELVLLREATKTANVKTVTASHLAIASQCLSLLISLIPNLGERLRKYLKPEQFARLDELDRVLQDYVEHRMQIFQEFVTMMGKRADDCIKAYQQELQEISLATFISSAAKTSKAFENLLKKTSMLHKILRPIMPGSQFRSVFRLVCKEYDEKFRTFFASRSSSQKEKQRIMNDVIFLLTGLRGLEGVDDPGDDLLVFVQSKK